MCMENDTRIHCQSVGVTPAVKTSAAAPSREYTCSADISIAPRRRIMAPLERRTPASMTGERDSRGAASKGSTVMATPPTIRRRTSCALILVIAAAVFVKAPPHAGAESPQPVAPHAPAFTRPGTIAVKSGGHVAEFDSHGLGLLGRDGRRIWRWTLLGIETGRSRWFFNAQESGPKLRGRDIVYTRGTVLEMYRVNQATISQQFVIAVPPAGGCDLQIEGAFEANGQPVETADGWQWIHGDEMVQLSRMLAFDALGRNIPARMSVTANRVTFRLDGAALATAVYPVIIDPEIGTNDFRISDVGPDGNTAFFALSPAIAYNSTDNEYLIVWLGNDNGEMEIYGQRVDAETGAELGTNDFRISDMGPDGDNTYNPSRCAVAYNSTNNEYLVVWRGDDNTGGLVNDEFEIFGQRLDGATGAALGTNDFRISDMNGIGSTMGVADVPHVAYNSTNNEYLVVWRGHEANAGEGTVVDEFEIWGQRLNAATGAEVGENDFRISEMGPNGNVSFFGLDPRVAYNRVDNEYLVVWSGDDTVDNEVEIWGQRLDAATGADEGGDFRISRMGPDGDTDYRGDAPAVAHNPFDNEYLVVWHGDDNTPPHGNDDVDVYAQRLMADGTEIGPDDFIVCTMGPDADNNFNGITPDVAFNTATHEYIVVWHGDNTTDNDSDAWVQRLDADGNEVGVDDLRISDMGPDGNTSYSAVECRVATSQSGSWLMIWTGDDNTAPLVDNESEIFGQLFSTIAATSIDSDNPDPSVAGQIVTVNFSVTSAGGTPTGNVTISDGDAECTADAADGSCELVLATAGDRTLTATYEGDLHFSPGASAAEPHSVVLDTTTTTITDVSPDPSTFGQAVTISFEVTAAFGGTPTGDVTISDGTDSCTADVADGSCAITFSSSGTKTITASYAGDAGFAASESAATMLTVNADPDNPNPDDPNDPSNMGGCCGGGAMPMAMMPLFLLGWARLRRCHPR